MTMSQYDLTATEYFTFTIPHNGEKLEYHYYYPKTEELQGYAELAEEKQVERMLDFVKTPEGETQPNFVQIYKNMNIKQVKAFTDMIVKEFGVEENQTTKNN